MSAVPGAGHATLTYNSNNITAYVDQIELQAAVAELEQTNLGSSAQEFVPGLPNWNGTFNITKWDKTIDGYLAPDVITPTLRTVVLTFTDSASQTVTYTWTANAFITGYNIAAAATGKVESGPTIRFSGNPSRS